MLVTLDIPFGSGDDPCTGFCRLTCLAKLDILRWRTLGFFRSVNLLLLLWFESRGEMISLHLTASIYQEGHA